MQPWRGEPAHVLVEPLVGEPVCCGEGGGVGHSVLESRTLVTAACSPSLPPHQGGAGGHRGPRSWEPLPFL